MRLGVDDTPLVGMMRVSEREYAYINAILVIMMI
jgi:hypothetical protein